MSRPAAAIVVLIPLSLCMAQGPFSRLVYPGPDGHLVYTSWNDRGDRVPDFSTCGYRGGGLALPEVETKRVLSPVPGDNRERIQDAINDIAELPLRDGFRGALLLTRGRYEVGGTLRVTASGVVLRGQGHGEDGTVLVATDRRRHTLITFTGAGRPREEVDTRTAVTAPYVPVGSAVVPVADTSHFRPGDTVIVERPSTAAWIAELGMDRIREQHDSVRQWAPGSYDLRFQRIVTAVRPQALELDAPLVCALDEQFGGGSVYRYSWPERIENVGIEMLRGESEFDARKVDHKRRNEPIDEDHAWVFVSFGAVRDGWVDTVTSCHFGYSCVAIGSTASRMTVRNSACLDPVSRVQGGRRYSFAISGQLNLVRDCRTRGGRHDFVMHARVPGPNVFLNCRAERAYSDSGPHHRWATGTLYDSVTITGNALNVQDRQWSGTGHGWAGANMVFWNCTAAAFRCQKPPTAQNVGVGCTGPLVPGHYVKDHPDGWWESPGQPVTPGSLYLRQLADRMDRQRR